MSYVIVSADFPGVTTAQRNEIYTCLKEKEWHKVTEPGRDIDTVWYASFAINSKEVDCIRTAINHFKACSSKYCKVKLAIHWGPNRPTFEGLT